MPGMTWRMKTSGPTAGTLTHPLEYTETEDEATGVKLWLDLATPAGQYPYRTSDGLDHARMLDPRTSDAERQDMVRVRVLANDRVEEVTGVDIVTNLGAELPSVSVTASYTTATSTAQTIGFTI